jgi:hypothetical protein
MLENADIQERGKVGSDFCSRTGIPQICCVMPDLLERKAYVPYIRVYSYR